jgi:hypothetical protein
VRREGIWASNPDIRGLEALVEELRARGTTAPPPKGTRFGVRLTGAAYYRDLAIWAADPRPDVVAFRALVAELRERKRGRSFVDRLRARLDAVATLPVAERRQRVGLSDELLEAALSGQRLQPQWQERLDLFIAEAPPGERARDPRDRSPFDLP